MRWTSVKRWVPLFGWILVILGVSSIPRLSVDNVGMPEGIDKVAHYFEYLVLALLFHHALSGRPVRRRLPVELLVVATGLAIAAFDEIHQGYIPGRDPNIFDFAADGAGILTGMLIGMRMIRTAGAGTEGA